jgi:2-polyprenyl-6-hydroxyphenyl methylase/3-demethylubiquinone-9 3-methyltransferase
MQTNTIDQNEIAKFEKMAAEWWDPHGKFKPLHQINPLRISYINQHIDVNGKNILDIGCGGGLLCEPLTRMGAKVTGIDASEKNINIASLHAKEHQLEIDYRTGDIENLEEEFDIILNMEVVEHVADVALFLQHSARLLKPGGLIFLSTINRTIKAYMLAIVGAEYVMRWLPRGTHDWKKFLTPAELASHLRASNVKIEEIKGMSYNLLNNSWHLSEDIDVNYILIGRKM